MRVEQRSSDIAWAGDTSMAGIRLTLVVTDLRAGHILFASGALTVAELAPLEPLLVERVPAVRARNDAITAPGPLPAFVAPREAMRMRTVCHLVHVDLDRQVALWELESRSTSSVAPPVPAVQPSADRRPRDVPRRIVCIDNDPDGLEVLRLTLSSLRGVQFVSATTGRDGLALLHESRPALLLIDLQLPDVSGATIVELCRRSTTLARMPVVVLTADASVATRRAIEAVGVAHLAIKPFDLFELRAVVEHLLAVG